MLFLVVGCEEDDEGHEASPVPVKRAPRSAKAEKKEAKKEAKVAVKKQPGTGSVGAGTARERRMVVFICGCCKSR